MNQKKVSWFYFNFFWQIRGVSQLLWSRSSLIHQTWFFLSLFQAPQKTLAAVFFLADTSPNQQGAWLQLPLNSRFFQPVVSIPHASLGAKCSSSAPLLSHLTGRMWYCTWPLSQLPPRLCFIVELFHQSSLIVHSLSSSQSALTPPPCGISALRKEDKS